MIKQLVSGILLLNFAFPAFSTPDAPDKTDDIEDQFSDEFDNFYGSDEFISIATGSQKSLQNAPAVASVITAEQIRQSGARNLIDALSMVPGLHIGRNNLAAGTKFSFRGITSTFGPQTLMMLNGVPTKSVVRGDNNMVRGEFPVNSISRIEVIRGPGSALYGADAFAGVINIITKDARELSEHQFGGGFGTQDSVNAWLNTGMQSGDLELGISVEYLRSDGLNEIIEVDAQTALDQAFADFGAAPVSLAPGSVNMGFESLDVFIDGKYKNLSMGLFYQNRSNIGTGQGIREALDAAGKFGGYNVSFDLLYEAESDSQNWQFSSRFNYYASQQKVEENVNLLPPGTLFGTFPEGLIGNPGWKEDTTRFEFTANYSGLENHALTLGAGHINQDLYQVTDSRNFLGDFSPIPTGLTDVTDTPEAFIPEASRDIDFLLIQDIWKLAPDWELTTGVRYDHYSDFGSTANPRLSLVWSSSLNSTVKFLYGRAFRAPNFAETLTVNNPVSLGNPDLRPETIDSLEGAYSYRHNENHTSVINFFYYKIDDFITFVPDQSAPTNTAQNVGERTGYGVELETSFALSDSVSVKAKYSYVKAQDDVTEDDVGDYPNHMFKAELLWKIDDYWSVYSDVNLIGERRRTPIDTRPELQGFNDVGLALQFNDDDGYNVTLSIDNAFKDNIREPSTGPRVAGGPVDIPFDIPFGGVEIMLRASKSL